jgi:hypothetical protein
MSSNILENLSEIFGMGGKKKRAKSSRKSKRLKLPRVIKKVNYQTGKRKSIKMDRAKKALPPGKRISKSGKMYWETRRNRSDLKKGI